MTSLKSDVFIMNFPSAKTLRLVTLEHLTTNKSTGELCLMTNIEFDFRRGFRIRIINVVKVC